MSISATPKRKPRNNQKKPERFKKTLPPKLINKFKRAEPQASKTRKNVPVLPSLQTSSILQKISGLPVIKNFITVTNIVEMRRQSLYQQESHEARVCAWVQRGCCFRLQIVRNLRHSLKTPYEWFVMLQVLIRLCRSLLLSESHFHRLW